MAGLFNTNDLKAALKGGSKADRFSLIIGTPSEPSLAFLETEYALVKTLQMPERRLGRIEVWVQGRKLLIPSNTEYTNVITLTIYNTPEHDLRQKMLDWQNSIDKFSTNWQTSDPWPFCVDITLKQLGSEGKDAKDMKTYVLKDCFPSNVGPIDFDAQNINQVTTFQLEMTFTYMEGN